MILRLDDNREIRVVRTGPTIKINLDVREVEQGIVQGVVAHLDIPETKALIAALVELCK